MAESEERLRVCLVPLGCPKNLVDSEKMLGELAEAGLLVAAPMHEADVIVVNTCGFIAAARTESIEVIEEALAHKRSGPARRVVVAGCLPIRDGELLYEQVREIDAIVGVNNRADLLAAVRAGGRVTKLDPHSDRASPPDDRGRFRLTPRHTAYLRIAEGCSRRCSYCTVPAIRGPFRSKPPTAVLAEARELIADGAVELNVIAQDTTGYGRDLGDEATLGGLLRGLSALEGAEWIRLLYAYPRNFTDELIDAIAHCEHVVPYVDIPLQHISDGVLKRMRRGVTRKELEETLGRIRERVEGVALRTTFIVGFPGESDAEFAELLQFVRDFRFDALGVFEFSPEEGTRAGEMPNQVPDTVKRLRAEQVMLAQQEIVLEANRAAVGAPVVVLVDGVEETGRCVGRSYRQAPDIDSVCILTHPRAAGELVEGTVAGIDGYDLVVQVK